MFYTIKTVITTPGAPQMYNNYSQLNTFTDRSGLDSPIKIPSTTYHILNTHKDKHLGDLKDCNNLLPYTLNGKLSDACKRSMLHHTMSVDYWLP